MTKLQSIGVEAAVVKDAKEMYEDPHLKRVPLGRDGTS